MTTDPCGTVSVSGSAGSGCMAAMQHSNRRRRIVSDNSDGACGTAALLAAGCPLRLQNAQGSQQMSAELPERRGLL
jgi:hypothetical protein